MAGYKEYREALIDLLNSIRGQIQMSEENLVLILHLLNTPEKMMKFAMWVKDHAQGEKVLATEAEICRAAVHASK